MLKSWKFWSTIIVIGAVVMSFIVGVLSKWRKVAKRFKRLI